MIAKVVQADGEISLEGEVAAIRWAVDQGARVINLSLGGVRDPLDAKLDTYSPLEQAAIEYAYSKGVVVVAAVGNGPQSPATPWRFAHYPAALPHVIGVSAIRRNGSVPDYSNRDAVYNDLTAPGDAMFSTVPRNLVEKGASCVDHPYSDCGPFEFRNAIGTSFAAPQVSAAAALLLGQRPSLRPEQVAWLLERSATDASALTGCAMCPTGRDLYTGWGTLDVLAALDDARPTARSCPPPDRLEPNDDAGPWAHALPPLPRTIDAIARLLGRQHRRLPGAPERAREALRAADREGHAQAGALGAGHTARRGPQRARRGARHPGTEDRRAGAPRLPGAEAGIYYLEVKLVSKAQDPVSYRLAARARLKIAAARASDLSCCAWLRQQRSSACEPKGAASWHSRISRMRTWASWSSASEQPPER